MDAPYQVGLIHPLGEMGAELARVRERAHQYVDLLLPGGVGEFQPIPLALFPGRVLDLGGRLSLYPAAGAAVRTQRPLAQPADKCRVALGVAQPP